MPKTIIIREATERDTAVLAELMNDLGYATTLEEMTVRFNNILKHADYKTFVATVDDVVVGMIGLMQHLSYEQNGKYIRILALVTDKASRGQGIGQQLMATAENWANEIGAASILLNCGNRDERKAAHTFYQKRGYSAKSTGYVKKKAII